MKKMTFLLMSIALLSSCSSMRREVYVVPTVNQPIVVDEEQKITKVYYSKKYYDSSIKITPATAAEKLANIKLPTPVLISGVVKDSVDYQNRKSISTLKNVNWLGEQYKGAYMFNDKNLFIAKFPIGSRDYKNGFNYMKDPKVTDLFCIAKEAKGEDVSLISQDIIWFSVSKKENLAPILKSSKKTADGKSIYIDFVDCAFVKFSDQ